MYVRAGILICDHWFHAVLLRQSSSREKKILEKSKKSKNAVKRMLGLCTTHLCVCVCVWVCVDYICILLCVVVYVIVSMYVYDDTWATRKIWGCLLDIWVAMYSESRDRLGFDQIIYLSIYIYIYSQYNVLYSSSYHVTSGIAEV